MQEQRSAATCSSSWSAVAASQQHNGKSLYRDLCRVASVESHVHVLGSCIVHVHLCLVCTSMHALCPTFPLFSSGDLSFLPYASERLCEPSVEQQLCRLGAILGCALGWGWVGQEGFGWTAVFCTAVVSARHVCGMSTCVCTSFTLCFVCLLYCQRTHKWGLGCKALLLLTHNGSPLRESRESPRLRRPASCLAAPTGSPRGLRAAIAALTAGLCVIVPDSRERR